LHCEDDNQLDLYVDGRLYLPFTLPLRQPLVIVVLGGRYLVAKRRDGGEASHCVAKMKMADKRYVESEFKFNYSFLELLSFMLGVRSAMLNNLGNGVII
jgi:hypothetical protein